MSAYDALTRVATAQVVTAPTTTNTVPMVPCETHNEATFYMNITAIAGTSIAMNVAIETSPDGTNWWYVKDLVVGANNVSNGIIFGTMASNIGRFVRLRFSVVSGTTPSFTVDAWINTKRIGS